MNIDEFSIFTSIYGILYNRKRIPGRLFSPLRFIIRKIANKRLPKVLSIPHQKKPSKRVENLIISLTSYPARIDRVWLVIECLKRQTFIPERIVLYLYKEQFKDECSIPDSLKCRVGDLFEIRIIDDNVRSHTKYLYAFEQFPEKIVVTVDDDIYYHPKTIEYLVETHKRFPGMIAANITSKIKFDNGGCVISYKDWDPMVEVYDNENLLQKGVGGVLYPPGVLPSLVMRKDIFMSIIPFADDLWLNAMTRLNDVRVIQTPSKNLLITIESDSPTLDSINNGQSKNDIQLNNLRQYLMKEYSVDPYKIINHG